ncbi:hypothetical protein B0H13DRAFT_1570892, partial [Mycena leptocephala]
SAAAKKRKAQKQKAHAKARGVNRGSVGGKHDAIFVKDTPPLDPEAADEGLHVLVQTGTCRRGVLTKIYNNNAPSVVDKNVQIALDKWRTEIFARDYRLSSYSSSMTLREETIALLSSVGPIKDLEQLKTILADQWLWIEEYGEALYLYLAGLGIPPMQPLPKKSRAPK